MLDERAGLGGRTVVVAGAGVVVVGVTATGTLVAGVVGVAPAIRPWVSGTT